MASLFWRRVPAPLRPPAIVAAKAIWLVVGVIRWRKAVARFGGDPVQNRRLLLDSLWSGVPADEIVAHRAAFPNAVPPLVSRRSAHAAFNGLGDARQKQILRDKLTAAECLGGAGIAVAPTLLHLRSPADIDFDHPLWSPGQSLFVKPRFGWGGKGVFQVDVRPDGRFAIDEALVVDQDGLRAQLRARLSGDSLLVQRRVPPSRAAGHDGLGRLAPVLRLTTVRMPGGPARLHDAYVCVFMPGSRPADWHLGIVRFPVDPQTGALGAGLWFAHPETRFSALPWNGRSMVEQPFPQFAAATDLALKAADLFPGLPIVGWDIVVSDDGPVILEGNTGLDWELSNLRHFDVGIPSDLPEILLRWRALADGRG